MLLIAFLTCFIAVYAQTNIPANTNAPGAASVTIPGLPAAYSAGTPVNYVRSWQPLKPYTSEADVMNASRLVEEVNRST